MTDLRIAALRKAFAARELSPVELTEALLARAARSTAFTVLDPEGALAAARDARGPLAGIPVAVKDLIDTAGVETSYGSPLFAGHVPAADAPVVATLRAAGAVILGKTRTHEFAWGITSEPTGHGPVRNPHDPERIAGGSSGGSAAAVAEGLCSFALGTDTAGSVRIPAAFCGGVGMRPAWGTLPVGGVFALAPSFDAVGVLAATVEDAETALRVLGAPLPPAGRGAAQHGDGAARQDGGTGARRGGGDGARHDGGDGARHVGRGLRVVRLRHPFEPALHPAVAAALAPVLGDLPVLDVALDADPAPAFAIVQGAEALAVHTARGRYPHDADGYDPRNRERLDQAAHRPQHEVDAARAQLDRDRRAIDAALATVDVALAPVHGVVAPRIGEADDLRGDVLPFTIPQSLAGLPACAVPAGTAHGLPVGVQVCAARGADAAVLAMAATLGRPPA